MTSLEGGGQMVAARSRSAIRVALVTLIFCAAAFAFTFTFGSVAGEELAGMGSAALFPRLVIGVMALLAVLMAFGIGAPPMDLPAPVHRMSWLVGLTMVAYMGAVVLIGLWPASMLFLILVGRMWGQRNWLSLSLAALGMCAALYGLFVTFLHGMFPSGLLFGLFH